MLCVLAEAKARKKMDKLLFKAGWIVPDFNKIDFSKGKGIAVRKSQLTTEATDYILRYNKKPIVVIETKPVGHTLGGVEYQSKKYREGLPERPQNIVAMECSKLIPYLPGLILSNSYQ